MKIDACLHLWRGLDTIQQPIVIQNTILSPFLPILSRRQKTHPRPFERQKRTSLRLFRGFVQWEIDKVILTNLIIFDNAIA